MVYLFMGNKKGIITWNKGKTKSTDPRVNKISLTMKAKKIEKINRASIFNWSYLR